MCLITNIKLTLKDSALILQDPKRLNHIDQPNCNAPVRDSEPQI